MSELVEKAADAIINDASARDRFIFLDDGTSHARAAIAVVFDWLAAGRDTAAGAIAYPGSERVARDYWPIMLAEMRKAALGG